uniref:Uncharacterized protein n=1 Tax=Arundo donax TaxID=35708 RepID=A0A0A9G110_ARUDO
MRKRRRHVANIRDLHFLIGRLRNHCTEVPTPPPPHLTLVQTFGQRTPTKTKVESLLGREV